MMSPEHRYLSFALIASRTVICCNALKKDGKYGEGQNRTAEREFSPFVAPGVTCDSFLLIIVKEFW
jgi:hypothetical protein